MKSQADRRIIVLESNQLLNSGVQSVLQSHGYKQVIGVPASDMEEILHKIESYKPDVIIMDETSWEVNQLKLTPCLVNHTKLRTVIVNLYDNHIWIYEKRNIQIHQTSDFIEVL
jgi:DNA-binding NarL/FixJ family response regulator